MILVERYHIVELIEAAKELLANYPIADDTVLEVAGDVMEYTNMFEAEAQQLLLTCAKFLKPKVKVFKAMTRYAKQNENRKEVFALLLAKMDDIPPTECTNCKNEICQDGEPVTSDDFREGLLVINNKMPEYWGYDDWGTGRVTKVGATEVTLEKVKPGVNGHEMSGDDPKIC